MSHKPHYLSPRRRMRIIGRQPLSSALDAAVAHGVEKQLAEHPTGAVDVATLQKVVRQEFGKIVRQRSNTIKGISKSAFLEELRAAQQRGRALGATIDWNLDTAPEETSQPLLEDLPEGAMPQPPAMVVPRTPDGEIDAVRLQEMEKELDLYKRRVAKLVSSLDRAEAALAEYAEGGETAAGLASVYRTVQGLASSDRQFALKRELLSKILEANIELQKKIATSAA